MIMTVFRKCSASVLMLGLFFCSFAFANSAQAGKFCLVEIPNMPDGIGVCESNAREMSGDMIEVDKANVLVNLLPPTHAGCASAFKCVANVGNTLCAGVASAAGAEGFFACTADPITCTNSPIAVTSDALNNGPCPSATKYCCQQKDPSSNTSVSTGSVETEKIVPTSIEVPDPLGGITIPVLIGNLIKSIAGITGSIALLIFVMGGFEYIYSGGDSAKIKSARARMINGAIGIILIYGAYFFASTIMNLVLVTAE
jgi:hypothetical protein